MNRGTSLSVDNILRFLQLKETGAGFSELLTGLKLRKSDQRPLAKPAPWPQLSDVQPVDGFVF